MQLIQYNAAVSDGTRKQSGALIRSQRRAGGGAAGDWLAGLRGDDWRRRWWWENECAQAAAKTEAERAQRLFDWSAGEWAERGEERVRKREMQDDSSKGRVLLLYRPVTGSNQQPGGGEPHFVAAHPPVRTNFLLSVALSVVFPGYTVRTCHADTLTRTALIP